MRVLPRIILGLFLTALVGAGITTAVAQRPGGHPQGPPDPEHHAGGRLTAINGTTLTVTNREGETQQIATTADTTFERNGKRAQLAEFAVDDFVFAEGDRDAAGTLLATHVGGGDKPPRHHGMPGPPPDGVHAVAGKVVSVDASARTLTLQGPDDATEVVYTTETTRIEREHAAATLTDFTAGDHAFASGARSTDGRFVADRIMGGSGHGPEKHHGDGY
jgi:hypothetical protein